MAYKPDSPAVERFLRRLDRLNVSARNMILNWPWPLGADMPHELALKAQWRILRCLPDTPYEGFA